MPLVGSHPRPRLKATMKPAAAHFDAIGTKWDIQILEPIGGGEWTRLHADIRRRIEVFDRAYSRFRSDSLVSRAARQAGRYELPSDGYKLLKFYEHIYKATDGKVTPLIGQVMEASGYDAAYSFKKKDVQRPPLWEEILSYDKQSFTLASPAVLDFGAAGKGYLVDIVGELIEQTGRESYLINAGGDIRHRSTNDAAINVGLENPLNTSEAIGIVQLNSQSLCASAGNKRTWGEFNHIIDPSELQSPSEILASWVVASDTMTADGLATALFFAPPVDLQKQFSFSYAVLHKDMSLQSSPDFPAEIFTGKTL
jgi:FAD:protein FMN transferase